jgi:hypothetical protein
MKRCVLLATTAIGAAAPLVCADGDPFADVVVSFEAGVDPHPSYPDPTTALGSPERFTGEGIFPAVVSAFNPAWGVDEIVSLGSGGFLVVEFDCPITDDPRNRFGIDLIIFGNAGFLDAAWPNGIVSNGLLGAGGGGLEVSADGVAWIPVPGAAPDGLYPTIGYCDAGPYDEVPGATPTSFTKPLDPSLAMTDFVGLNNEQVVALYGLSGGGLGVDLGTLGLAQITHVRISNPADAMDHVEVDALADVTPLGDLNEDGSVNVLDLIELLLCFGQPADPPCHLADVAPEGGPDGAVDVLDLIAMLLNWGD